MNKTILLLLSLFIILEISIGYGSAKSPTSPNKVDSKVLRKATQETDQSPKNMLLSKIKGAKVKEFIQFSDNQRMSLNFIDVDIQEALSALAMQREINIVTAPDVSGEISLHLYDVTLDEALNAICLAGGFAFYKRGDLYYVSKPEEVTDPELENLQMRIFKLKYAEMDKIQEILSAVPDIRMVKIHEPTKTIIVEDIPKNIKKIETIINSWDTRPRQVLIEAKVLDVRLTDDMVLGVDWDKILGDARVSTAGFSNAVLPDAENVAPAPTGGLGIFSNIITGAGTSQQFAAALDALKAKTTVDTLSTPRILAIHGKPAKVQVGGQQGYRLTTVNQGISTETIQFIDTGVVLDIIPYIDDEGNILLDVRPSVTSAVLEAGIPVTKTAFVSTWLLAKNGETVFIGGLIQDIKAKENEAVPVLGSIPGLGILFGRNSRNIDKFELIVLITPRIVDGKLELLEQQALEKTRKQEKIFKKEPISDTDQLKEFLFPGKDGNENDAKNSSSYKQYDRREQH